MSDTNEIISSFGEAFRKKTTAFLTLGVLLMIASMYFSKVDFGNYGLYTSIIIIFFALLFQIISWINYFFRESKKVL